MRLLLSWVRDFVDVRVPAADIAETLALRGFEVAAIEGLEGGDAVIDFEVTANRPDGLSVLGLAREIATTYDLPLTSTFTEGPGRLGLASAPVGDSERIKVVLEEPDLCPRYATAIAELTATAT